MVKYFPILRLLDKDKKLQEPKFCSMGMDDGAYDYVFGLINEYQKDHPNEFISEYLVQQLIKADREKKGEVE